MDNHNWIMDAHNCFHNWIVVNSTYSYPNMDIHNSAMDIHNKQIYP